MIQRNQTISFFFTFSFLAALGPSGCMPPSLLITPVSSRRDLVESNLGGDSGLAAEKILIIDVSGLLLNGHSPQLLGEGEHSVSLLLEQLDKARKDPAIKAVVLRINSPGGTVTASELMHDEIRHFRKQTGKPVLAVLMDVAASGGYYVACACDEIVAQPMTVTGSIGVVMQMVDVSGTMGMIGIKADAITSGIHKDSGSPLRTMRPEERELFQAMVNEMYERFVQVVVQGRPKLDEATVRRLADGRVYTAKQALDAGLVDRIATPRETLESLKQRLKLRRVRWVGYHRAIDYRPNYYAAAPAGPSGGGTVFNLQLPSSWLPPAPQFLYLWTAGQ